MADIEEYFSMPNGEQDCPRCGEPVYNDHGFVYSLEYWHTECYEEEHGALPEVPEDELNTG